MPPRRRPNRRESAASENSEPNAATQVVEEVPSEVAEEGGEPGVEIVPEEEHIDQKEQVEEQTEEQSANHEQSEVENAPVESGDVQEQPDEPSLEIQTDNDRPQDLSGPTQQKGDAERGDHSSGPDYVAFENSNTTNDVSMGEDRTGSAQINEEDDAAKEAEVKRTLHISGLDNTIDSDKLREWFEPYGILTRCEIITSRGTGASKGYGFVAFDEEDIVEIAASEMNGKTIDGQTLIVQKANPKKKKPSNFRRRDGRGGHYGSYGSYGSYQPYPYRDYDSQGRMQRPRSRYDPRDPPPPINGGGRDDGYGQRRPGGPIRNYGRDSYMGRGGGGRGNFRPNRGRGGGRGPRPFDNRGGRPYPGPDREYTGNNMQQPLSGPPGSDLPTFTENQRSSYPDSSDPTYH
ncbi:hypothetical protein CANCADRAFT_108810 [Tortispora caseinolytica NRRL Y-17796]|uniref:RRM domain-containing protein n=1 Tax=Tortispora caseinolytica NRRL Y-17796 TaxID=767744 RepID=A0A1E4TFW9_9ASCO|nr:hypothetical protein CANCADRAFT_108810 [Tortispora caseinolytica NRRL Y-17796]